MTEVRQSSAPIFNPFTRELSVQSLEKIKKGMVNPTPWSISERQVTDEDFINWKNKKQTP